MLRISREFVVTVVLVCLPFTAVLAQAVAPAMIPTTVLTIAPSVIPTTTPTVQPGDNVKLDLSQFSSSTITITLLQNQREPITLLNLPLLTDGIGVTVTIPETVVTGPANLRISGQEKGEQILMPLTIVGVTAEGDGLINSTSSTSLALLGLVTLLLLVVLFQLRKHTSTSHA